MVRVLLDATAVPEDRGGVGRYVDNLIPALARAGVDLRVVCQASQIEHYAALGGTDPVPAPAATRRVPVRLLWEQAGLPRLVSAVAPDVVHSPHYTHPAAVRRPLVITLHDATFFTDRHVHTALKGAFFRAATRSALHRADCSIVPSQATAEELARVVHADPARLQVAHHGVDHTAFAPPTTEAVGVARCRLGLGGDESYIAFLGTLEPRKNVPALIAGWVAACAGRERAPALVLAGGAGWDDDVASAVAAVPGNLKIIRAGYVPQEELAGLLGGAVLVAYPSLGEGFGLPVLEAMACGAPVLTTRRLALPEVGGDAVAYTEPDAPAIAAALAQLLDDDALRLQLAAAAVPRAATFTWDACADAHVRAYERAVRAHRSTGMASR